MKATCMKGIRLIILRSIPDAGQPPAPPNSRTFHPKSKPVPVIGVPPPPVSHPTVDPSSLPGLKPVRKAVHGFVAFPRGTLSRVIFCNSETHT